MTSTQVLLAAISPSLVILAVLWRFNNNVVKANVALASVIKTVETHDHKIETHGYKISELIGAVNTRTKIGERLDPLRYEGQH